jgi:ribonucleoside-diphosphate reductase alpha chain
MKNLPTPYQDFIHKSRYARWNEEEKRREDWNETVSRYVAYIDDHLKSKFKFSMDHVLREDLYNYILDLKVMPSMRAMMTAGEALDRDNICGYNCSYIPVDHPRAFDECMYILMCGTGVGFSVERENVDKLPIIAENFHRSDTVITVADSRMGWAKSYKELVALLYSGQIPTWDVSSVRPAGAKLKVMGGRASGPEPLVELFDFTINTFKKASGRKLYPIECHDIMCKVGQVVVVGGVRRSALISLSNLGDDQMRHAKSGTWWETQGQRALANNSVSYKFKPEMGTFMREWVSLYESKSGERGMFNREASDKQVARNGRRDDTLQDLKQKVRMATILGTFQSTLTNFKYLRKIWKQNTEEERLLGVSLTGIMDHPVLSKTIDSTRWLKEMKDHAVLINQEYAKLLGIPQSAAITCVKPSGTVSQLTNSASGIHARHSEYYIRTVRADNNDPLTKLMKDEGVMNEPDVMKPDYTTVFSFPTMSPKGATVRKDVSAIEQLELWKIYAQHWCEHKPSITVTVKEDEWMDVGAWVYENFDIISGISFLPYDDHTYQQAPYQDCTKAEYSSALLKTPKEIDFSKLSIYEKEDGTTGSRELACTSDACEVVDIGEVA